MNYSKFVLFLTQLDKISLGDKSLRRVIKKLEEEKPNFANTASLLNWLVKTFTYINEKCRGRIKVNDLNEDMIRQAKTDRERKEEIWKLRGINYITYFDEDYPYRFKEIEDFPIILYYRGNIKALNSDKICAIIGTREPSEKAKEYGAKYTREMVSEGSVIVSGLALGCDTIAHEITLELNGVTVAFLGTGVDKVYPQENELLAQDILSKNGLLISEYEPGKSPTKYQLVERDRLQAASSDKVIVLETGINGGSMHAANKALEYKREVYVLDPKLVDNALGNLELSKDKRVKVIKAKDIK